MSDRVDLRARKRVVSFAAMPSVLTLMMTQASAMTKRWVDSDRDFVANKTIAAYADEARARGHIVSLSVTLQPPA
jgi:hypothetical protein